MCVNDLPITGDLSVLSPSDKSLQRPREQEDWQRAEHLHANTHTHAESVTLAVCVLIELSDKFLQGSQQTNAYHTEAQTQHAEGEIRRNGEI